MDFAAVADLVYWALAVLLCLVLVGVNMYAYATVADLERDFLNPVDAAERVNEVQQYELSIQWGLCASSLLVGKLLFFALQLPLAAFLFWKWKKNSLSLDATTIYQTGTLGDFKRDTTIRTAIYACLGFFVLYQLISVVIVSFMRHSGDNLFQLSSLILSGTEN